MADSSTRDALLEQGALLFARRGVAGVTAKELHAAAGARNASALHYHFGGQEGLVAAIVTLHVDAVEARRARLVAEMEADGTTGDVPALVRALAAPMADDLTTPLGRAHLRLVAQVSHPSLAYAPAFQVSDAPAGTKVVRWLSGALRDLPEAIRRERLVALRAQLIGLFGFRATLRDAPPEGEVVGTDALFLENLVDLLVAGLQAPPSAAAVAAARAEDIEAMSDDELAAEAYVAGYPMVVSIRTLQRLGGLVGTNALFWQTELAGPDSRVIVAPNRDTLYSIAVLDLRSEPLVLTLPEVTDRYHTYQLLSPWTDSFAYIGTRATGGRAGSWVIAPPGWEGEAPDGAEVIESPTHQVFLLGRFLVDDDADVAKVVAIRDRSTLQPLSAVTGGPPGAPLPPLGQPAGTAQDIPTDASFFAELAPSLAANRPPTDTQVALWAAAADRLGIGADGTVDGDPAVLDAGAAAGAARITAEVRDRTELVDGWTTPRAIGVYGDDVALRAFVASIGWGANVPEEAVYPVARVDVDGEALDGSRTYTLTFPADRLPPLEDRGFWSLSAYGADMFFTPHPSGRYTIGDRTPDLPLVDDGSLTITLAHDEPAGTTGWLPVPRGPFVLMLRLYLPAAPVLDGEWIPPGVVLRA